MSNYGAEDITVLEGLEAVRKRPGMYIGNTGKEGLHRCLGEIMDNSVDEYMADYGTSMAIIVRKNSSVVRFSWSRNDTFVCNSSVVIMI